MDPTRRENIRLGVKKAWADGKMSKVSDSNRQRWKAGTRKPPPPDSGAKISEALKSQYKTGTRQNKWLASKPKDELSKLGKKAQAAAPKGAKHASARWWDVRDPRGVMHRFRNLNQFLRDNPTLFDPEDLVIRAGRSCRASKGFTQMFARQKASTSWKGWTPALINHDDTDPLDRHE